MFFFLSMPVSLTVTSNVIIYNVTDSDFDSVSRLVHQQLNF